MNKQELIGLLAVIYMLLVITTCILSYIGITNEAYFRMAFFTFNLSVFTFIVQYIVNAQK